jgi:SOS-response transcriptional repressor LexA
MSVATNISDIFSSNDKLAINLRRLLSERNISEAELARQTDIPQPTLHKILSGKTADPRASTLKSLADFFGLTIDALISGESITKKRPPANQPLPIISWADCPNAEKKLSTLTHANWNNWVLTESTSSNAYALISKASMEPKFPKGSVLIIDPEATLEDGDLVVVHFKDTGSVTIRELSIDGPIRELSTISKSPIINTPCDDSIKILGVLIKSIFTFE